MQTTRTVSDSRLVAVTVACMLITTCLLAVDWNGADSSDTIPPSISYNENDASGKGEPEQTVNVKPNENESYVQPEVPVDTETDEHPEIPLEDEKTPSEEGVSEGVEVTPEESGAEESDGEVGQTESEPTPEPGYHPGGMADEDSATEDGHSGEDGSEDIREDVTPIVPHGTVVRLVGESGIRYGIWVLDGEDVTAEWNAPMSAPGINRLDGTYHVTPGMLEPVLDGSRTLSVWLNDNGNPVTGFVIVPRGSEVTLTPVWE